MTTATATATATYEIRSYTLNSGGSWEWNGDGWDVEAVSAVDALKWSAESGDWSAYAPGEMCRLEAWSGPLLAGTLAFIPNPG